MKAFAGYLLLLLCVIISCTSPPDYPNEPVIEFNNLSQNTMQQGEPLQDSIILTFDFTDGDGDLGSLDDSLDVFLIDLRFPEDTLITFKLPFVPEQGTGNGISGEISLALPATCCFFPPGVALPCSDEVFDLYPVDTLVYEVFIYDRSGNSSNAIRTDEIYISCN